MVKKYRGRGVLQKKILLLLLGGVVLGLSQSPRAQFRIMREIAKEWKEIDRRALARALKTLYRSKLIEAKSGPHGTWTLVLSEEGKKRALSYDLDNIQIKKPPQWDGKWRIVMFDIPERVKKVRELLRMHLKDTGFYEFQKSVFVLPYPCESEIEYIMEFYNARKNVRFITAIAIDNELELQRHFRL